MSLGGTRAGTRSRVRVRRLVLDGTTSRPGPDWLATEEPLEIRLAGPGGDRQVAVTMRTPGADLELAAGFLHGEGIVTGRGAVRRIRHCADRALTPEERRNVVTVDLASPPEDLQRLDRHFTVTSACGVCGKQRLDQLECRGLEPLGDDELTLTAELLYDLPGRLRDRQRLFERTGGLHAAALFDRRGRLVAVREDVGRHNALDKLVGWALLGGRLPLDGHLLLLSGRASFELVQKALAARIPVVAAISAPSSLAVDLARRFGMTLVGFLRDRRCNLYAGGHRLTVDSPPGPS